MKALFAKVVALLVTSLMLVIPTPAVSVPSTVTVNVWQSWGTTTPGLHMIPVGTQFFTLVSLSISTVGTAHKQTVTPLGPISTCAANGLDGLIPPTDPAKSKNGWPGDSLLLGTGLGVWSCSSGPLAGKSGFLYYTRVGPVLTMVLTAGPKSLGQPTGTLSGILVPTQLPPAAVTTYAFTGVGSLADVL
jgi:hypothetical protein